MTQLIQLPLPAHRNHYLFSDYYLNHRVAERREWRDFDAQPQLAVLTRLWQARKAALPNANESQTEADWIRPMLDALGHRYTAQVPLVTPQGSKIPDYILCSDEATRTAIQTLHHPAAETDLAAALAAVRTRIERIDRLIDQVVYRLNGLKVGEIAVVEGTNS